MDAIAAPKDINPYVPAFTVRKLEGKRKKEVRSFDDKGNLIVKEVEVDAGWLVSFPAKKHSIRIDTKKELERLGFDQTIKLVNDEGDVGATMPNPLTVAK